MTGVARRATTGLVPFSGKMERCIHRRAGSSATMRIAGWDEIAPVLSAASLMFPVAPADAVRAVHDRQPQFFRAIDVPGAETSLVAYLALNEEGATALVTGRFDGTRPDASFISAPGEPPAAIYIWMTWTPGRLGAALPRMIDLLNEVAPAGCPLFSRAVTSHAARLNASIGFRPATEVWTGAPDWLLVILPKAKVLGTIEVRPVRSLEDVAMVYAVRAATYLSEQYCLYGEEFDGNDFCATQLVGFIDGDPAGCIRMRYFGDFVKVERLAVRREYRTSRLAFRLVREALGLARRKGFGRFYGHAREDLVPFWSMFGFRPVGDRGAFRFADVSYREMLLEADRSPNAIGLSSAPMVTIRPEGAWERPGPLELSNLRPSRVDLIAGMRTIPLKQGRG